MTKIIIDRKTWYRGLGPMNSRLLNDEDKMCCLGFTCLQLGSKREEILKIATPLDLDKNPLKYTDEEHIQDMMATNDDINIDDIEREEKLKELAKEIDLEFEFIN